MPESIDRTAGLEFPSNEGLDLHGIIRSDPLNEFKTGLVRTPVARPAQRVHGSHHRSVDGGVSTGDGLPSEGGEIPSTMVHMQDEEGTDDACHDPAIDVTGRVIHVDEAFDQSLIMIRDRHRASAPLMSPEDECDECRHASDKIERILLPMT